MKSIVLCAATLLLLQHALTLVLSDTDTDDADDQNGRYRRTRRGWSMMRLGRGLQMLRLGKRTAPAPHSPVPQATPEKMRELLGALLEESRHDFRRQPPMPRYGRELEEEEEEEAMEELYDLLRDSQPTRHQPYPDVPPRRVQRSAHVRTSQDAASYSDRAKQTFSSGS